MELSERGKTALTLSAARATGDKKCDRVFYSCTHMDRPRCYILMREDYLWSPLQSACSMQHLRSVWFPRQTVPPPPLTLSHCLYPPPFFRPHLQSNIPPSYCPCTIPHCAGPLSHTFVLYSLSLLPQTLRCHNMQICSRKSLQQPPRWLVHTHFPCHHMPN